MRRLLVSLAGVLLATTLHASPAAQAMAQDKPSDKTITGTGTVTAVSGSSLTVKGAKEEMTFTIDEKTKVTASGGSTKTREKQAAGQKTMITDFVGVGDQVRVTYHDMGATKHAASVTVTHKAPGKK